MGDSPEHLSLGDVLASFWDAKSHTNLSSDPEAISHDPDLVSKASSIQNKLLSPELPNSAHSPNMPDDGNAKITSENGNKDGSHLDPEEEHGAWQTELVSQRECIRNGQSMVTMAPQKFVSGYSPMSYGNPVYGNETIIPEQKPEEMFYGETVDGHVAYWRGRSDRIWGYRYEASHKQGPNVAMERQGSTAVTDGQGLDEIIERPRPDVMEKQGSDVVMTTLKDYHCVPRGLPQMQEFWRDSNPQPGTQQCKICSSDNRQTVLVAGKRCSSCQYMNIMQGGFECTGSTATASTNPLEMSSTAHNGWYTDCYSAQPEMPPHWNVKPEKGMEFYNSCRYGWSNFPRYLTQIFFQLIKWFQHRKVQ